MAQPFFDLHKWSWMSYLFSRISRRRTSLTVAPPPSRQVWYRWAEYCSAPTISKKFERNRVFLFSKVYTFLIFLKPTPHVVPIVDLALVQPKKLCQFQLFRNASMRPTQLEIWMLSLPEACADAAARLDACTLSHLQLWNETSQTLDNWSRIVWVFLRSPQFPNT